MTRFSDLPPLASTVGHTFQSVDGAGTPFTQELDRIRSAGIAAEQWVPILRIDWDAGWPSNVETGVTPTGNTYTYSAAQQTSSRRSANTAYPTGHITTAGATGNDRRFVTFNGADLADGEIRSLWYAHSSAAAGQFGHVHRLQNIGNTTTQKAIVVWIDDVFAQEDIINYATWMGTAGNFGFTGGGNTQFDGITTKFDIVNVALAGNVATFTTSRNHNFAVGDAVHTAAVPTVTFYNGNFTVVTVPSPTTFTVALTHANDTTGATTGWCENRTFPTILPLWVASRVVGSKVFVKAWAERQAEPSWSNPNFAASSDLSGDVNTPAGVGRSGILHGHVSSGSTMDYGPVRILLPQ